MAVIKQGGTNPYTGMVSTTRGPQEAKPPVCGQCRERKLGLYTIDANGTQICADCSGRFGRGVLQPDEDSQFDVSPGE